MRQELDVARLVVSCADRTGIIAALSSMLAAAGANIVHSDQHSTDPEGGSFFLRMEFHLTGLADRRPELESQIASIAGELGMDWRLSAAGTHKRVALFASRYDHCLLDLLWRWRRQELADGRRLRRLQPPRPRARGARLRGAVPLHPRQRRDEGRRRGARSSSCWPARSTSSCSPATCRC